jgi:hypothetical protein
MLGAAHRPRESLTESAPTFMADQTDGCRQRAVSALGTQRYTEHEQHGRSMTIHDALAFALRALAAETGPTGALGRSDTQPHIQQADRAPVSESPNAAQAAGPARRAGGAAGLR